uniref:Uncharacterized protein n=1 Tax=Populus trichocarpa TaxID=3694 RepID=A0A2K1ZJB6_POPTR
MIACHRNEPRVYQPSQKEFQFCAQSSSKIRGPWRASVQYLEQFGFGPDWARKNSVDHQPLKLGNTKSKNTCNVEKGSYPIWTCWIMNKLTVFR